MTLISMLSDDPGSRRAELVRRVQGGIEILPLLSWQRRLWLLQNLSPSSSDYNLASVVRIEGPFDIDRYRLALHAVSRRQPALRAAFVTGSSGPLQVVMPARYPEIEVGDWALATFDENDPSRWPWLAAFARRPFDLERGPLWRVLIHCVSPECHVVAQCIHHIICDGASLRILFDDIVAAYLSVEETEALPPLNYGDYVRSGAARSTAAAPDEVGAWKTLIGQDLPVLRLPMMTSPSNAKAGGGPGAVRIRLPEDIMALVEDLSRRTGISAFVPLLTAFGVLLWRRTSQTTFGVGVPVSVRAEFAAERLVGMFVNTLPFPMRVRPDLPVTVAFEEIGRLWLRALDHRTVPLDEVVTSLQAARGTDGTPLFQTMFNLVDAGDLEVDRGSVRLRRIPVTLGMSQVPLSVTLVRGKSTIDAEVEYDGAQFDPPSIRYLIDGYVGILRAALASPQTKVRDLEFVGPAEAAMVRASSAGERTLSAADVVDEFALRVYESPGRIALQMGVRSLTYEQLEQASNHIAHTVLNDEVRLRPVVAICGEQSLEMLAVIVACLKAARPFVCIDTTLPIERAVKMVQQADAGLVVRVSDGAPSLGVALREVRLSRATLLDRVENVKRVEVRPSDRAYLMFTSGSTGVPKATIVTRANIANAYLGWRSEYRLSERTHVHLNLARCSFDVFVGDVLRSLCSGGTLLMVTDEERLSPVALMDTIARQHVTCLETVPALARALVETCERTSRSLADLEMFIVGSDLWYVGERRRLRAICGKRTRIVCSYGTAETTIDSSYFEDDCAGWPDDWAVPVGIPFQNVDVHVLTSDLKRAGIGTPAEVYIGGAGVGQGYFAEPAATAASFVPDPFARQPGARLYKTGDIGRVLQNGALQLLGRRDGQVKVRGMRVELAEIEGALSSHPDVQQVVVTCAPMQSGVLTAHYVGRVSTDELGGFLARVLPAYMVPKRFVQHPLLPTLTSGKIDRMRLAAEPTLPASQRRFAARPAEQDELCGVIARAIGIETVTLDDNFFALGGDSLAILKAIGAARASGLALAPRDFFEARTIGQLAARAHLVAAPVAAPDGLGEDNRNPTLSPMQRQFLEDASKGDTLWTLAAAFQLHDAIDEAALQSHIAAAASRYDAFLSRFKRSAEGTWEVSREEWADTHVLFSVRTSTARTAAAMEAVLADGIEFVRGRLSLEHGPLIAAVLASSPAAPTLVTHVALVVHHLVADVLSLRVMVGEINRACRGHSATADQPSASVGNWMNRARSRAQTTAPDPAVEDVLRSLEGAVAPLWDEIVDAGVVADAESVRTQLDQTQTEYLKHMFPTRSRRSSDVLLLTALVRAFRCCFGDRDVVIDLEQHGRAEADIDLSHAVGWFTTLCPTVLRSTAPDDPVSDLTEVARRTEKASIAASSLMMQRTWGTRTFKERVARVPTSRVSFNYIPYVNTSGSEDSSVRLIGSLCASSRAPKMKRTHVLEVDLAIIERRTEVTFTCSPQVNQHGEIAALASAFTDELRHLIAALEKPGGCVALVSDFPLVELSEASLLRITTESPDVEDVLPVTAVQAGIVFQSLLEPGSALYTDQMTCTIRGEVDVPTLSRAWCLVLRRHPLLRARMEWKAADEILQVVEAAPGLPFEEVTLGSGSNDPEGAFQRWREADRQNGFNLGKAPLMRLALIHMPDGTHRLVWTHHHVIVDGWSMQNVLAEVVALYDAMLSGQDLPKASSATPRDFFRALHAHQDRPRDDAFWARWFNGVDWTRSGMLPLARPLARPRGSDARPQARLAKVYGRGIAEAISAFAKNGRLTVAAVLEAVWSLVLARLSGWPDVVFAVVTNGRLPEIPANDELVGMFVNTLPMRVLMTPGQTIREVCQHIMSKHATLQGYATTSLAEALRAGGRGPMERPLGTIFNLESLSVTDRPLTIQNATLEDHDYHISPMEGQALWSVGVRGNAKAFIGYDDRVLDPEAVAMIERAIDEVLVVALSEPESTIGGIISGASLSHGGGL